MSWGARPDMEGEGGHTAAEEHVSLIHTHLSRSPGGGHGTAPRGLEPMALAVHNFNRF
jgi:hypothetical protein